MAALIAAFSCVGQLVAQHGSNARGREVRRNITGDE
jgi:hypothetical protein